MNRIFRAGLLALGLAGQPSALAAPLPCDPEGSIAAELAAPDAEGVFVLAEGYRIRLANIVWPDHLEPGRRAELVARIAAALANQRTTWKPAAGPDRWGVTPAHVFVTEATSGLAPFWLQAGLVEFGLVPAWPEPQHPACWNRLAGHEAAAVRARRGYWAPRAQPARHRAIEADRAAHAGRRIAALWRVASVRPWRAMHFVNFVPSFRGGPALGLSKRQMTELGEAGQNPQQWPGRLLLVRLIVGGGGLSRLRVETIDHISLIE